MSAPAGWHPQPDGRERWWDGQQWTEHFRDPATAAPTPGETQVLGTTGATTYGSGGGYGTTEGSGYPAPDAYGAPGTPGATGYGTPAGQWPPQQKQGMSGTAKGCLIAAVVVVVLVIAAVVVGGIFFARTVSTTVDQVQSAIPSNFPSNLPTNQGDPVTTTVGGGFDLPNISVADGWTLEDQGGVGKTIENMTGTFTGAGDVPTAFSMTFTGGEQTLCTASPESGSDTVTVSCIPVFGDVADDAEVTVTPTF
ncbi:DUF2510 domain-containing protein [Phycicoccus sp. HDW14]|uniref:DUF2510 domain-containing protein n=1 Tax=Phycicoccus sp. HDW14 TaxID=2714941 RepID=UPI00140E58D5|nr:DUF2510 domain-containing protein [Phycicoccus sp. HDW14]QIM22281.1 DUF2510 domain-containing protein [Phycicoccus sp. HDW14]